MSVQNPSQESNQQTPPPDSNTIDHSQNTDTAGEAEAEAQSKAADEQIQKLTAELEAARSKTAETHDRMLRIAADFENSRKRWEKEREEIRKYAISEFARELLPVIDSFDKAMTLIENVELKSDTDEGKTLASVVEGVQIVSKVFHDSIKKHGIERLPGKGQPFNPEYHNAIARHVDAELATDTVVEEFVSGYKIGDRVLRTAMVKVATKD